jgi:hypothetical protein
VNLPEAPTPKREPWLADVRTGLILAGIMLAIPFVARWAARLGWGDAGDLSQRALMTAIAAYLVLSGNSIPKRLASLACGNAGPAEVQAFARFAGWTWVLTGIAFGLSWVLLPGRWTSTATLVILPIGIALVALRWLGVLARRRPAG